MIGVVLFVKREDGAVRLLKYQLTPVFRRALSDELTLLPLGIWSIGPVQLEGCAIDCLAVLVDLRDLGRRQGGEVELERHVRCARAALQIEETQRMLGAVAEGVAGEVGGICAGSLEHRLNGGVLNCLFGIICIVNMTDMNATGGEVDLERRLLVDATQIAHEYAIDVHPDVVVTRELKDHVVVIGGLAARMLDKLCGHGHAKVVVEARASVHDLFGRKLIALFVENFVGRVKGEELA